MRLRTPSFDNGFARSADESAHPGLWRGLIGAWVPSLGPQGIARFKDISGYGRDGVFSGTIANSSWVATERGYAFAFDGSDDSMNTGVSNALLDFSIFCCFKATSVTNFGRLVDKTFDTGTWLGRNGTGTTWGGGVLEGSSPFGRYVTLSEGAWHTLVSKRAGTTHTVVGDGGAVSTSGTVSGSALDTTTLRIGTSTSGGSSGAAQITCVLLYDRALTEGEIALLHANAAAPFVLRPRRLPMPAPPLEVSLDFISSAEQSFGPAIKLTLSPGFVASGEQLFALAARLGVAPGFVASGEQLFALTARLGVAPGFIASGEQTFNPTVRLQIAPGFVTSEELVHALTMGLRVMPGFIASEEQVLDLAALLNIQLAAIASDEQTFGLVGVRRSFPGVIIILPTRSAPVDLRTETVALPGATFTESDELRKTFVTVL